MVTEARRWWILLLCVVTAVMIVRILRGSFDLGNFSLGFFGGAAVLRVREFVRENRAEPPTGK
jgi:hypothetical protein